MKITKDLLREMIAEEIAVLEEEKNPTLQSMVDNWNKIQDLATSDTGAFRPSNFRALGLDPKYYQELFALFTGETDSAYGRLAVDLNKLVEKENK